jgi:hypothetical protein
MCRRQDEEEQERGAQIADVRPGANDGDCVQGVQQGRQMTEQPQNLIRTQVPPGERSRWRSNMVLFNVHVVCQRWFRSACCPQACSQWSAKLSAMSRTLCTEGHVTYKAVFRQDRCVCVCVHVCVCMCACEAIELHLHMFALWR